MIIVIVIVLFLLDVSRRAWIALVSAGHDAQLWRRLSWRL